MAQDLTKLSYAELQDKLYGLELDRQHYEGLAQSYNEPYTGTFTCIDAEMDAINNEYERRDLEQQADCRLYEQMVEV